MFLVTTTGNGRDERRHNYCTSIDIMEIYCWRVNSGVALHLETLGVRLVRSNSCSTWLGGHFLLSGTHFGVGFRLFDGGSAG
jgi:hypothetical protein